MQYIYIARIALMSALSASLLFSQQAASVSIPLAVESGTPLRVYLTHRVSYRLGAPVSGRLVTPVWAFDRIVIPAGSEVHGVIVELNPVGKMERTASVIRGDFTPLKRARVRFDSATLAGGKSIALNARPSLGLDSIYVPPRPSNKPSKTAKPSSRPADQQPPSTAAQLARQQARQQINQQISARTRGVADLVRSQNKKEWLEAFLWGKLPYHPQWYRSGTRFDAVLNAPLTFGAVDLPTSALAELGGQPAPDQPAQLRFASTVSSGTAHLGDPVTGVLTEPVFSADHKLLWPEGTTLSGKVTLSSHAKWFHRGGQLRFSFDEIHPAPALAAYLTPPPAEHLRAGLTAAEATTGPLAVDPEGTATATESKTRFLRPVIAGLIAAKSMDNDEGHQNASGGAVDTNATGRSLGGFSGFGLLGTAAAQGPRFIGAAMGFYGLGWSVYSNIISRGREIEFNSNAAMSIKFQPPSQPATPHNDFAESPLKTGDAPGGTR